MVLAMPRCSVVGKWAGGAVGPKKGKFIGTDQVSGQTFVLEASFGLNRHAPGLARLIPDNAALNP